MKTATVLALAVLLAATSGAMAQRVVTLDCDRDSQLMDAGCGGNSNKGYGGKSYYSGPGGGAEHNDTVLLSFDLSGVTLAPGEYVASGKLSFWTGGGTGTNCDYNIDCYPMLKTWVEGVGVPVDGFGGSSYPWGPASVNDSVHNYQTVSTVGLGSGSFATQTVATSGIPWHAAGAKGTNDADRTKLMTDGSLVGVSLGNMQPLGSLDLTAVGCDVVEDWITGSLANNGLVMIFYDDRTSNSVLHLAHREYGASDPSQTPGPYAPELELTIAPEPATIGLLVLGSLGLILRRRRRK